MRPVVRAHAAHAEAGDHAPLDHDAVDAVLGGGLTRGGCGTRSSPRKPAIAAPAHGFALALALRLNRGGAMLWIQEERARAEDGAPYPQGIAMMAGNSMAKKRLRSCPHHHAAHPRCPQHALGDGAGAALSGDSIRFLAEVTGLAGACDLTASRRLVLAAREGGRPRRGFWSRPAAGRAI